MHNQVYIGIGSNLHNPYAQVERAIVCLDNIPSAQLHTVSPLYLSQPLGQPGQSDYINAVACLSTTLSAERLLDALQAIEHAQGRVRDGTRWGSRTLDLDILLYNDAQIHTARLSVPHPEIANRVFVLEPLYAIAPTLSIPSLGSVVALRQSLGGAGITRLDGPINLDAPIHQDK